MKTTKKTKPLIKIPARGALLFTLHFMCLLGGIGRLAASPTALSIPGAATATIEPAEAVTDGARWSLDGGAPRVSGESITNLAAGSHTIQFSKLAGWLEPDDAQVLVIGGKQASVSAK